MIQSEEVVDSQSLPVLVRGNMSQYYQHCQIAKVPGIWQDLWCEIRHGHDDIDLVRRHRHDLILSAHCSFLVKIQVGPGADKLMPHSAQ